MFSTCRLLYSATSELYSCFSRRYSTVYALSSGQGKCGVAVIRVTGPNSSDALRKLTARDELPKSRSLVLRSLYDPVEGSMLDRALVTWMPAPATFTGEDCCEFHTHGGAAVVSAVLRALSRLPHLSPAQPGDFTRRAFFNHKLDMTQVEGLADLIHAETEYQRRQALRQMDGELGQLYSKWRAEIVSIMAATEAAIDFSEDDQLDVDHVLCRVVERASSLHWQVSEHLKDANRGQRLRDGVRVCIAGAVNAGKSSLLNKLVRRDASIVSGEAGTTRDLLESTVDISGLPTVLTDTAGLRESDDAIEREGVRRARNVVDSADLVLLVIDSDRATVDSFVLEEHMRMLGLDKVPLHQCLLVFNKHDLLSSHSQSALSSWCQKHSSSVEACTVSCSDGTGIEALVQRLSSRLQSLCVSQSAVPSRERHVHHLQLAGESLVKFASNTSGDLALSAHDLRVALHHMGQVTGHVRTEEVLDVLFSDFCIGK